MEAASEQPTTGHCGLTSKAEEEGFWFQGLHLGACSAFAIHMLHREKVYMWAWLPER